MEKILNQENGFLNQFAEAVAKMSPEANLDFLTGSLLPRFRKANLAEVHPLVLSSLVHTVCAKILVHSISQPLTQPAIDFIEFAEDNQLLPPIYRSHFLPQLPESPPRTARSRSQRLDSKFSEILDLKPSQSQPAIPNSHPLVDSPDAVTIRAILPVDSHPHSSSEDRRSNSRSKRSHSFHLNELERHRGLDSGASPSRRSPDRLTRKPKLSAHLANPSAPSHKASKNRSSLEESDSDSVTSPATGVSAILNRLLVFESKPEKTFNKNFGYALMELNGDFVWCDPNSEKYFEIKSKELSCRNFFDMLIPFSKAFLAQKFGSSLFSKFNTIGASVSFSYVIYSKNSMNKFLKCLKKIGVSSEEEFKLRLKRKDSEDAIYHQYLKALSTRATMILLKFTDAEVQKMILNKEHNLNPTRSFAEAIEKVAGHHRTPSARVDSKAIFGSDSRMDEDQSSVGRKSAFEEDDSGLLPRRETEPARPGRGVAQTPPPTGDLKQPKVMVRQFVLLETRLALNVPMFDYRKMCDDPKIKNFEQKIIKKITKGG